MNKMQSNSLAADCRLYGLRKAGIVYLKQMTAAEGQAVPKRRAAAQLAAMRRQTERLESFFDEIERTCGIDSRLILWRYLVSQEEISRIARDYRVCHQELMRRIEAMMREVPYA
jgi:hypothetical protein